MRMRVALLGAAALLAGVTGAAARCEGFRCWKSETPKGCTTVEGSARASVVDRFGLRAIVQQSHSNKVDDVCDAFGSGQREKCDALLAEADLPAEVRAYALFLRATFHVGPDRHERTIEDMNQVISLRPDLISAYAVRASAHGSLNDEVRSSADRAEWERLRRAEQGLVCAAK